MKNNPILKLNQLAMIIPALLLLLSSCQQDESYNQQPSGSTLVNLSVSTSNSAVTSVSDDPASAIKSLCILQFNANGSNYGTLRHIGVGTESTVGSGRYSTTLLQSINDNDKYKLVVLANFPHGYGIFQSMMGKTYAEVQQVCLSKELTGESNVLIFNNFHPFPMFGIAGTGDAVFVNETMNLGNVSLVRAVARVDIGVGKKNDSNNTWDKNGVNFNMTQIQVWKAGKQYAYMPLEGNFSSAGGTLTISGPSPVGTVETKTYGSTYITSGTYCSEKMYLPEADLQWGSVYDTEHANRLAIIVGGKYNNSQKETFYRMDFIRDDTGEKMDIRRNHVYQFTIRSVTDDGYDTTGEAYTAVPKGLSFTASIDGWKTGVDAKPLPQEGFLMSYGAQSGSITSGEGMKILKKSTYWNGESTTPTVVDYNTFYGEVPGNLKRSTAYPNGDIYPDLLKLTEVEGVYPSLMVATDDIYSAADSPDVHWKDGLNLTAFDLCRNYSGLGYSDWRLPRAPELVLMYLNRTSLEKQRGFTAFSGAYWSGSEKGSPTDAIAAEAWVVSFGATPRLFGANKTTGSYKIRCVRQVSNSKIIEP